MAQKDLGGRAVLNFLDADVLIQLGRDDPDARAWLLSLPERPTVPGVVALEYVTGSRDGIELRRSARRLRGFSIRPNNPEDYVLAYDLVLRHKLSTGLGLADYLIAAQALNLKATLYTFNLKHFGAIPDLDAQAPYPR